MSVILTSTLNHGNSPVMMTKRLGLFSSASFFTAFILLTGCAKDKTTDEYHQQKADQQAALYQSISASLQQANTFKGSYVGPLTSDKDGSSMGNIQIELWPETQSISSSDNTGMANQTVLKGKVTLSNTSDAVALIQNATFTSADYSTTGSFDGTIPITLADGTHAGTLSISGNITNGTSFQGHLHSSDQVGISTTFKAVKTASQNSSITPVPIKEGAILGDSSTLMGRFSTAAVTNPRSTTQAQSTPINVRMTIRNIIDSPEEDLLDQFILQKRLNITLNFSTTSDFTIRAIVFTDAKMFADSGRIIAKTIYIGDVNTTVTLDCAKTKVDASSTDAWQCTYNSTYNGTSYSFQVTPEIDSAAKGN